MHSAEIAALGDDELLRLLQERKAPILTANTTELGDLFAFSYHAYSTREFALEGVSFKDQFYTSQKQFPSMCYPENRHLAKTPEGAGKAADLLHMYLRTLGIRIANVIIPAAKKLVGDEAVILKLGRYDPRERRHEILKDRPPNEAASKILQETEVFEGVLKDAGGNIYALPLKNEKTTYHQRSSAVLETALALREQSVIGNARRGDHITLPWIRDLISLQSVETMVQIQQIIERGIQKKFSGKMLEDFNLTMPVKDRVNYARAVFERAHETRRDHALMQIELSRSDDIYRKKFTPTKLALSSVGESSEGFAIRDVKDAAVILATMPRTFHLFQYAFTEEARAGIPLPMRMQDAFRTLAEDVLRQPDTVKASALIRRRIGLLREALVRNEVILRLVGFPVGDSSFGINKAYALLTNMMEKAA